MTKASAHMLSRRAQRAARQPEHPRGNRLAWNSGSAICAGAAMWRPTGHRVRAQLPLPRPACRQAAPFTIASAAIFCRR